MMVSDFFNLDNAEEGHIMKNVKKTTVYSGIETLAELIGVINEIDKKNSTKTYSLNNSVDLTVNEDSGNIKIEFNTKDSNWR